MCGICGIINPVSDNDIKSMVKAQQHRGPDGFGFFTDTLGQINLAHNRLSIIDLSDLASQPMNSSDGRYYLVFNGEIYNYLELKAELSDYPFRSLSDSEVILAAYHRWGKNCLDHFLGMFAFLLWDDQEHLLFAARDRFGVKPLYFATSGDTVYLASEIKTIHAAGFVSEPNKNAWATFLTTGLHDFSETTFWEGVNSLPAGHYLTWQNNHINIKKWYDLADHLQDGLDTRANQLVEDEYFSLLQESIKLRFRSDVPVGINLSGGLDSSTLLYLVQQVEGERSAVSAFTFITGDSNYDELPWVEKMLDSTCHPLITCKLSVKDVPKLATSVAQAEDEPFGGLPTLAYARLFEEARERGVIVLLDGQGMDEQWAGYSYYRNTGLLPAPTVQGANDPLVRPACVQPEFARLARPFVPVTPFDNSLLNLQYRDIRYTKIPRALRYNDRISMRASVELREPFLDHRLVELALRQPNERKVNKSMGKLFLRSLLNSRLPSGIADAPKRPLQTPQREWLRGPLRKWAEAYIEFGLQVKSDWLIPSKVRLEWQRFLNEESDNSYYIWQWVNLGLMFENSKS